MLLTDSKPSTQSTNSATALTLQAIQPAGGQDKNSNIMKTKQQQEQTNKQTNKSWKQQSWCHFNTTDWQQKTTGFRQSSGRKLWEVFSSCFSHGCFSCPDVSVESVNLKVDELFSTFTKGNNSFTEKVHARMVIWAFPSMPWEQRHFLTSTVREFQGRFSSVWEKKNNHNQNRRQFVFFQRNSCCTTVQMKYKYTSSETK